MIHLEIQRKMKTMFGSWLKQRIKEKIPNRTSISWTTRSIPCLTWKMIRRPTPPMAFNWKKKVSVSQCHTPQINKQSLLPGTPTKIHRSKNHSHNKPIFKNLRRQIFLNGKTQNSLRIWLKSSCQSRTQSKTTRNNFEVSTRIPPRIPLRQMKTVKNRIKWLNNSRLRKN